MSAVLLEHASAIEAAAAEGAQRGLEEEG